MKTTAADVIVRDERGRRRSCGLNSSGGARQVFQRNDVIEVEAPDASVETRTDRAIEDRKG